jgi:Rieske Fe-S protein
VRLLVFVGVPHAVPASLVAWTIHRARVVILPALSEFAKEAQRRISVVLLRRATKLKESAINETDYERLKREAPPPITRRGFNKWFGIASAVALAGALVAYWQKHKPGYPIKIIAQAIEIPIGGCKIFTYPADDRPCFLLRPAEDTYVAFSRLCTHHTCPVFYQPADQIFTCPCHGGIFSASNGAVLGGPPPKPLPQLILERRGNDIIAIGFLPT